MEAVTIRQVEPRDFFKMLNDVDWCDLPRERDSIYLLAVTHQAPFSFLAEVDGRPVGVLLGHPAADRSQAYVQQLAITPSYQRQGIGTRLLQRFEQVCREHGIRQIWLLGTAGIYPKRGYRASQDYFDPEIMKYIHEVKKNKVQVKDL